MHNRFFIRTTNLVFLFLCLIEEGFIQGMHTFDDAFIYLKNNDYGLDITDIEEIRDVNPLILKYFLEN